MERRSRPWLALAALGLGAGVVATMLRKIDDFDLPWHLAAGRAMWSARSLHLPDDFSYTFRGVPVPYEPIADGLLYAAERLSGAVGIQLLAGLLIALLSWSMVARASSPVRLLGVALAAWSLMAASMWMSPRPALFSFALFSILLLLLDRHRATQDPRFLLWLVPLQWIWANCHGFAPMGAALLSGYAIYALLCRRAQGRLGGLFPREEGTSAGPLLLVAGAAVAVTCLSPFGPRIFTLAWEVRALRGLVTEWEATTPSMVFRYDVSFVALVVLWVFAVVGGREENGARSPRAYDLVLTAGALLLAVLRLRMIPIFAIAAGPFVARRFASRLSDHRGVPLFALISALGCAPVLIASSGGALGIGFDGNSLPVGAVDFLRAHRLRGAGWNFLAFGGYLSWRLHPDTRVFIDGRTVRLFPVPFVQRYLGAEHDRAAFADLDRKYHFEWAIVWASPGERFSEPIAMDRAWVMAYLDDTAAVYVRRDGANHDLAEGGYRLLTHLSSPGRSFSASLPRDLLTHDAALAEAQAPHSVRAQLFAAAACLANQDLAGARRKREQIVSQDPDHPAIPILDARLSGQVF